MTFTKLRVRAKLLALSFMPLVFALSACTTIQVASAPDCFTRMVGEELRTPTAYPPLPSQATAGAWVDQAQKERARGSKETTRAGAILHIGETCDAFAKEAKESLEPKWWEIWK